MNPESGMLPPVPLVSDIPQAFFQPTLEQREYLCDGEIRHWPGPLQEVLSAVCLRQVEEGPVRPYRLGAYPLMDTPTALQALEAAVRAWDFGRGLWPTLPVEGRMAHVARFLGLMKARREEVVRLLMWEIGKNLPDARKEFDRTVQYVEDTLDALKDLDRHSSRLVFEEGVMAQIRRAPLGVVLCMGPFNYPLNETFTTLIPALLMGNTVIFKPPKLGVLLHRPLLEAFREAFPPGVVNTVYGEGQAVVGPLMESGKVDVLAFIGSSRVAGILKRQHPRPHRLRSVLGLEAKNAGIILPHASLEETVRECLQGALSFNGQRCTALKILWVHRQVEEAFVEAMKKGIAGLKTGLPWEEGAQITPLPEPGKPLWLEGLVEDAVSRGARIVHPQGARAYHTWFCPTLLAGVGAGMRVYAEEQFGPVVPVCVFDRVEEPLEQIVHGPYGQQVSLFGSDARDLARLMDPLVNQVCRVNINSQCQRGPDTFPFTGRKDSAEGTLSVSDALRVFSIRTLAAARENDANREIWREILRERRSSFLSTDYLI